MKRILTALITLAFVLSSAVSSFAVDVYINEAFDSSDKYDTMDGRLRISGETMIDIAGIGEEFVIELDVVLKGNGDKRIISLKDDAKRRIDLVTASGSKLIFLGRQVFVCNEDAPVTLTAAVNLKTKNAGLFIDGAKYASSAITKNFFSYNAITHLSFKASAEDEMSIDNLRIYAGSELMSGEEIDSSAVSSGAYAADMKEYADVTVMFDESSKALSFGTKTDILDGAYPFEENKMHYVPLKFVLEAMGCTVTESAGGISSEGKISLELSASDNEFTLNGEARTLSANSAVKDNSIYVTDKDISLITGMSCVTANYTTVIGEEKRVSEITSSDDTLNMLFREVVFTVPSTQEIIANVRTSRPRVMAEADTFEKIQSYIASGDENMNNWLASALKMADGALTASDVRYVRSDGMRLDDSSDLGRINELAFAYRATDNKAYADKAWSQIEKICAFPDWNSSTHFLCTSGVMQSMAICYDWMYDYFLPEQREIMLDAIRDKGLKPALEQYTSDAFWVRADHNWNAVCNAGAAKLAIAVIDEPELQKLASEVLRESFISIRYMMGSFRPDGAWVEGVGYWYYMTRSLVQYMWTLETAYGSTFGIADAPGIAVTGYFPAHMVGPNGIFNISEGVPYTYVDAPELAWFANYLGDDDLRRLRYDTMERYGFKGSMIDMLLYTPVDMTASNELETDKHYRVIEAAVMRTSWEDRNGIYFGLAGGSNGYNHGHMDAGMFIFDANGVRWAIGLDGDDYNLPGYFAQGEGGQTWDYYRLRAEGHNTLVIAPDSSGGQRVSTAVNSPVIRFETDENGGIAVTDLTRNYDKKSGQQMANSIVRGARVDKNTGVITVQDEIELIKREDIYWFMHTEAEIEISDDGKTAMLFKDGKQCEVILTSPANAVFTVMAAQPLPTSPNPEGQAKNEEYRKLTVKLEKTKETLISVTFNPYGVQRAANPPEKIADWSLEDFSTVRPAISALYADGEAVQDFNPEYMSYDFIMKRDESGQPVVPKLSCPEAAETVYPESYPGTAYIILTDGSRYCVNISDRIVQTSEPVILPENAFKLSIKSAKAEAEQAGNEASGAIDGNIDTRWSGEGNVSITFDLGGEQTVDYARFSFYRGDERYNIFSIDTSADGKTWVTVFDGQSIEDTTALQAVKLIPTKARYVRYNGKGTTDGTWNSINEAEFYSVQN